MVIVSYLFETASPPADCQTLFETLLKSPDSPLISPQTLRVGEFCGGSADARRYVCRGE
jgi:hypothetical protein